MSSHIFDFDVHADDVADWTSLAQDGGVTLGEVLDGQLELLRARCRHCWGERDLRVQLLITAVGNAQICGCAHSSIRSRERVGVCHPNLMKVGGTASMNKLRRWNQSVITMKRRV